MCGIIAALCCRPVAPLLIEGLERLEYRGYDSAGIAVQATNDFSVCRKVGKVANLKTAFAEGDSSLWQGEVGIGHTRWATHGVVNLQNTHPHQAGDVVLVHNGIIENHAALRDELRESGPEFTSTTDSEVIAHLIFNELKTNTDFKSAVQNAVQKLHGAFAIAVLCARFPGELIAMREGSPLVLGLGDGEFFVASDVLALANITNRIVFLESGDLVQIKKDSCIVFDHDGHEVSRPAKDVAMSELAVEKDGYNHFMLKEIFEQPRALKNTYKYASKSTNEYFGPGADDVFKRVKSVLIIACGTSYHAGAVARYELEKCGIMAQVEVASEYLYRQVVVPENCLIVFLSQSGETADTIAALNKSKKLDYLACLSICNVENSSLNVQTDFACLTHAGREIGVAATKTFTAQLVALQALCCALSRRSLFSLDELEQATQFVLQLDDAMHIWAQDFVDKRHALYLGRGSLFPIAQEGALKLKEISYLHAEAYPAGELKHGPLALIDQEMPVIALAPDDELLAKMLSNLAEVSARGGQLYILTSTDLQIDSKQVKVFNLPECSEMLRAIVYTVPLQLLSYHVAVLKGADVDQPRNLAKSVTVE